MREKQRGFALPAFGLGEGVAKLALWVVILGLVAGIVAAAVSYVKYRDDQVRGAADAVWQKREAEREADNRQLMNLMNERYAAAQQAHQLEIGQLIRTYREGAQREKEKADAVVAGLRAGQRKLFDKWKTDLTSCAGRSGAGEAALPAAAAGGTDGAGSGELSGELAGYLGGRAREADRITRKLGALQEYTLDLWAYCSKDVAGP